eukprot:TRINITY_DN9239_c0_g2_i1.p1 TRINITY_DN9239_c0_g2~~TRINITY_DN9239_c0_g2_i1.p1  ORF type:complete len:272 (+),score=81.05 TRINITY_DN9239_c0_g2_i1:87-902(+)
MQCVPMQGQLTDLEMLQLQYWQMNQQMTQMNQMGQMNQMFVPTMMPIVNQPAQGRPLVPVVPVQQQQKQQQQQKMEVRKQNGKERKKKAHASMTTERPCSHNSWDNVRVVRKKMTLRCRVCQEQWRAQVEIIWKQWKCEHFAQDGKCPNGDNCQKLHLHYRKQGLEERISAHGPTVLKYVRNTKASDAKTHTSDSASGKEDLLEDLCNLSLEDKVLDHPAEASGSSSGSFTSDHEQEDEQAPVIDVPKEEPSFSSNELAALLSNLNSLSDL